MAEQSPQLPKAEQLPRVPEISLREVLTLILTLGEKSAAGDKTATRELEAINRASNAALYPPKKQIIKAVTPSA